MRYQSNALCLLLVFFTCFYCYSQETREYEPVQLRITKPTDAWYARSFIRLISKDITINEDEVLGVRTLHGSPDGTRENVFMNTILFQNEQFYVFANSTIPFSSDTLFSEDWISNIVGWDRKIWLVSYLLDVLQSGDRNTLYKYEKNYIDALNKSLNYDAYFEGWWRIRTADDCLIITQSGIAIGTYDTIGLWILNNKKIDGGYQITVQGDIDFMEMEYKQKGYLNPDLPVPEYSKKKQFDLLLIRDNDYMDVYLESLDNKLATFALVEPAIKNSLDWLIFENSIDLSRITSWPRRADGSMDYSLPTPNTLKEEKQLEPIDFSADSSDTENQQTAQNAPKTNAIPLWARLAIIGGAVIIAGGAVVFIVKRRK